MYGIDYLIIWINCFLEGEGGGMEGKMMGMNVDRGRGRMREGRVREVLRIWGVRRWMNVGIIIGRINGMIGRMRDNTRVCSKNCIWISGGLGGNGRGIGICCVGWVSEI